jgi:1-acyl-sn-glycerol-3-phosphate acyltransferase
VPPHLPETIGRAQRPIVALIGLLARPYFHLEVAGGGHVPRRGPAILAPTHDSMWDVPLLGVASPRTVLFMGKEAVFDNPLKRWFFTELGGFPVRRTGADSGAIRAARSIIGSGRVLGIFPEGTRTPGHLGRFHTGAARLALATGAPLIPVAITGTEEIWPQGAVFPRRVRVRVVFGPPVEAPPGDGSRRKQVQELTEALRGETERLLQSEVS